MRLHRIAGDDISPPRRDGLIARARACHRCIRSGAAATETTAQGDCPSRRHPAARAGGRGADRAVRGLHLSDKSIARRANTEPGGVARGQRDDRRPGIDDKVDAAAIDVAIDVKMALGVAGNDDRSRARIRRGSPQRRMHLRCRGAGAGPTLERYRGARTPTASTRAATTIMDRIAEVPISRHLITRSRIHP
jgi:hypothetical protein